MVTMEGYKGRKAPNVPHYLANLNALPSAHEAATQQQQQPDDYNIADELAQFTNTEFLDFDAGDFLERPMPEYDPALEEKARRENAAANKKIDGQGMDFVIGTFCILRMILAQMRFCSSTIYPSNHLPLRLKRHPICCFNL